MRLSDRGAFVLCELYKMRRMTVKQAARLCVVSGEKFAAIDMCRRLRALKYLEIDDLFRDEESVARRFRIYLF